MKKNSLLKTIGLTFLIFAVLSFIIPAGNIYNGEYQSLNKTLPIGLYDLFRLPVVSIVTFVQYGLLFLAIGGFYGVLNKTGVYSKIVDSGVKKYNKCRNKFLYFTIIFFALMVSIIGLPNLLFLLVPFFVAVLLKLGYSKIMSFTATVGSILFGSIGSTFAFSVWGYLKYFFGLNMTDSILTRAILLVMIIVLLIIFVMRNNKKETVEKEVNIPLYVKSNSKKSTLPLIIICSLTFALLFIGMYNWYYSFNIDIFSKFHEAVIGVKFGEYPIISNLLGSITELGYFSNYDMICVLIISSALIAWIYALKFDEYLTGLKEGIKYTIKPAIYSMLACVVFAAALNMLNTNNADFIQTIINKLYIVGDKFDLAGVIGSTAVASVVYNDFYTLVGSLSSIFVVTEANVNLVAFIIQTISGLVMVIAPTSVYLLAGLSYLDISYKDWIKHIWKFLLVIVAIVILVSFVLTMFI